MFVVRRAFRNYGEMMLPGSIVEPGNIKHFKTRLRDRVIVEVSPHNLKAWNAYFVDKFGVSLIKETPAESTPEPTEAPAEEVKPKVVASVKKPVVATVKK